MSEPSMWTLIRVWAARVMVADSRMVTAKDTLERLRQKLVEHERERKGYLDELNDLCGRLTLGDWKTLLEMDKLRGVLRDRDESHDKLQTKIQELENEIHVLTNQQVSFREELKEHLTRLRSYKYITVTGVVDLHALICMKDIKNKHALAFTLGKSTKGKDTLVQISRKMGIGNLKVGTLLKVQNGEFSVVRANEHGDFKFKKKK